MKKTLLLFYILAISLPGFSQIWPKMFSSGTYSAVGGAFETYDKGIIIGGTANWASISMNIWIIKTDINGDTLWTKNIPNSSVRKIIPTSDYGFLIIGSSKFDTTNYAPIAIKLNACGDLEWSKFLTLPSNQTYAISVVECNNKSYAVLCNYVINSQSAIFKLDSLGNILWQQGYLTNYNVGYSIYHTLDNGLLISCYGNLANGVSEKLILVKTDSMGQNISINPVNPLFGYPSVGARNAIQTSDGGYLALGIDPYSGDNRLFKLDSNFQPVWTKNYPMTDCHPHFIIADSDSTFIAPFTHLYGSFGDSYSDYFKIFRFDSNGDTVATATYLNPIAGNPYLSYIFSSITTDDKIILSGVRALIPTNPYHISLLKLTNNFDIDTNFISGLTYDTLCSTTSIGFDDNNSSSQIIAFPNPADDIINIKCHMDMIVSIKLFNVFGQILYERKNFNPNSTQINVSAFSTGLYFLEVETDNGSKMFRQVIVR